MKRKEIRLKCYDSSGRYIKFPRSKSKRIMDEDTEYIPKKLTMRKTYSVFGISRWKMPKSSPYKSIQHLVSYELFDGLTIDEIHSRIYKTVKPSDRWLVLDYLPELKEQLVHNWQGEFDENGIYRLKPRKKEKRANSKLLYKMLASRNRKAMVGDEWIPVLHKFLVRIGRLNTSGAYEWEWREGVNYCITKNKYYVRVYPNKVLYGHLIKISDWRNSCVDRISFIDCPGLNNIIMVSISTEAKEVSILPNNFPENTNKSKSFHKKQPKNNNRDIPDKTKVISEIKQIIYPTFNTQGELRYIYRNPINQFRQ